MKVRNIVRKAAVLGSAVTMIGATVMGAMAYNLADYPTKFIESGKFVGEIVVGEKAATSDVLGAVDIAASLQANSVTKEEVKIPGKVGEVDLGSNAFKFETSNDMLEIREAMGNVFDSLTDAELPALAGGSITTDQGSTDYNQYLYFNSGTSDTTLQAIGVNYVKNKAKDVADFLVIDDEKSFFKWELDFPDGLTSEITTSKLVDLEDETFNIFGTEFTFVDSSITTSASDITLTFMTGDVTDTLREGETKTYTLDGIDYEVTAVFISDPSNSDPSAKFSVNGELTDSLEDGDTDTLSGGLQIGVRDLLVNSRDGIVQFFLGADKIEFTDTNYAAEGASDGSIKIGSDDIGDANVNIAVSGVSSGEATIDSITYTLNANPTSGSVLYVPSGKGVRDFIEEPAALLSPTFDVRYEGLKVVPTTDISIENNGDDIYELTATNLQNTEYSWPIFGSRSSGTLHYGDDEADFIFYESGNGSASPAGATMTAIRTGIDALDSANRHEVFNIEQDDYFLLSDSTKAVDKQIGVVLRYESISEDDAKITFTDVSSGSEMTDTYTESYANTTGSTDYVRGYGDINVGGNTYWYWVLDNEASDFPIAFDVNGDSDLTANDETTFTVKGGGVIDFSQAQSEGVGLAKDGISGNTVNISLTTKDTAFDTSGRDEVLTFRVDTNSDDELDIATSALWWQEPVYLGNSSVTEAYRKLQLLSAEDSDITASYSSYGAFVEVDDTNDVSTLNIAYPESEVGAQVFVVAGTVEKTETSGGAVMKDVVNPIAVGLAVLDKETSLGKTHQIIVGGPCANTVAADFMGNPAVCGEGFEPSKAIISAKETGGKVAILVAGYEAKETLGASYVLADYGTYLADVVGSEVEVVASDLSDLKVMTPTTE